MRKDFTFVGALLILIALLFTPLVEMAARDLFSAHMIQHLLLVMFVAPLLIAGWPNVRVPVPLTVPIVVLLLHVAAVWAWHLPVLYDAAIENDLLHALEHASFLVTGVLFWGVVAGRFGSHDYLPRVGLVFGTALASGALGAVLAFASAPLYGSHLATAKRWDVTTLQDQQLAGGIMWVPPGVVYLIVMLVLLARWLNSMDRAAAAGESP